MYGKIFRQMYKGTLAMVGPWEALVTFQQMIVLADRDGIVDMTADAISRETTIPLLIIAKGIAVLELPDKESRSPDEDGRRIVRLSDSRSWGWRITNYSYYRQLRNEEERREYHRKYWREKRSKAQPDSTATQHDSTDSTNSSMQEAVSTKQEGKDKSPRASARTQQATYLPEDFSLTSERRAVAIEERVDAERTFETFVDYWRSASGAKARKRDWDATWRNWCKKAADYAADRGNGKTSLSAVERVQRATGTRL